jgi:PleD family two-component response regulator
MIVVGHQCPERSTYIFVKKPFRDRTLQDRLLDEDQSAVNTQSVATVTPPASLLRILLAEDNSTNQLVIKKLLASGGFHNLTIVENGKLAVEKIATEEFDVILMDMMVRHGQMALTNR